MLKSDWPKPPPDDPHAPFGPNGAAIEALLARARLFTRSELVRLDLQERQDPDLLLGGWDHVRDRLGADPQRTWRFAARAAGWDAVRKAASRLDLELPSGDGYWRAVAGIGAGAARVTRYAASALVDPTALDPEWLEILLGPWRAVIGDVTGLNDDA